MSVVSAVLPVRYAVPARQMAVVLGTVATVWAIVVGCSLAPLPRVWAVSTAVLTVPVGLWAMVRHAAANGTATLDGEALRLEPRRWAVAAGRGSVTLPWADVEDVRVGEPSTEARAPYVMLRCHARAQTWIVTAEGSDAARFPELVLSLLNETRERSAEPALTPRHPFAARGWRVAAALALGAAAALAVAMAATGRVDDWTLWARLTTTTGFALLFAAAVLRR